MKFEIKNVIATFEIESPVNLKEVYSHFSENSLYDDTIFNRGVVVLQNKNPKLSLLIYRTGKVICTGAESIQSAKNSDELFEKLAKKKNFELNILKKPSVNNIVGVAEFENNLDLEELTNKLEPKRVLYEPEQFPGLIYHLNEPDVKVLIFKSGKIVCVGGKTKEDLDIVPEKLQKVLK
ncbi:hypothetical protein AKJ51_04635 [candidate division MSBL1 archaeon SCGC-AAA382A20]|uniref:Uncharacterized protein n=1 Tax=candidate division MSBL1 archaeon SCGC-AAA382A20 TaxID=1698280 RepID=A0A133VHE1_9EURY|nr:hypothetical protein AKJ51_04635 [candidate division MSBL1 archaeon SCGC-AAA382A20]